MTRQQVASFFLGNGWSADRFGHLKKQIGDKTYRIKFQQRAVRYEVQVIHAASQYSPYQS